MQTDKGIVLAGHVRKTSSGFHTHALDELIKVKPDSNITWPIKQGTATASLMLRKLGSSSRQNGLAVALRELGRSERTLFIPRQGLAYENFRILWAVRLAQRGRLCRHQRGMAHSDGIALAHPSQCAAVQ